MLCSTGFFVSPRHLFQDALFVFYSWRSEHFEHLIILGFRISIIVTQSRPEIDLFWNRNSSSFVSQSIPRSLNEPWLPPLPFPDDDCWPRVELPVPCVFSNNKCENCVPTPLAFETMLPFPPPAVAFPPTMGLPERKNKWITFYTYSLLKVT